MFNEFSVCGKRACRVILILMLAIVLSFDVPVIMGQGSTAYADACIERFTDVSVGDYHLCLVTPDNKLFTFGRNPDGAMGVGSMDSPSVATQILENVVTAQASDFNSAALTKDNSLWFWGENILWPGDEIESKLDDGYGIEYGRYVIVKPTKIVDNVKSFDLGFMLLAYIDNNDALWLWGSDCSDLLGAEYPVKVMDNVKQVSIGGWGGNVACIGAVKKDGSLWTWGVNKYGNLGSGDGSDRSEPAKIMDNVASVSMGEGLCAAVKTDGSLWTWGEKDPSGNNLPSKVMDNVRSVSCYRHSIGAVKNDGTLWTWGWNVYGGLGDGTMEDRTEPKKILDHVDKVSMGLASAAIDDEGYLCFWGNVSFQSFIGEGANDRVLVPTYTSFQTGGYVPEYDDTDDYDTAKAFAFPDDSYSFKHAVLEDHGKGYYISQADYDRLVSDMPGVIKRSYIFNYGWDPHSPLNIDEKQSNYESWGGSCYGVTLSALLINRGYLDLSDVSSSNPSKTYDVTPSKKMKSVADFYQFQQELPLAQDRQAEFLKLSVANRLKFIENEIEEYGSCLVCFNGTSFSKNRLGIMENSLYGHAILAYDKEINEDGWDMDYTNFEGKTISHRYKNRFCIYDCNSPKKTVYLYYNENGDWFFPGSNDDNTPKYNALGDAEGSPIFKKTLVSFTPYEVITGALIFASGDTESLNVVDYHTGEYRESFTEFDSLYIKTDTPFNMAWGSGHEAEINDFEVEYNGDVSDENKIIPLGVPINGINGPTGAFRYILPDSASTYTIQSEETDLSLELKNSGAYTSVSAGSPGKVTLSDSGMIDATFDSKCDFSVTFTDSSGSSANDVVVRGKDSTGVSVDASSDAVRISGDDLKGTEITTGASRDDSKTITINSSAKDVEVSCSTGTPVVMEDKDGDGVYDDKMEQGGSTSVKVKTVKLSKTSYVYNGKARKPKVTVKDANGKVLKKNVDYKVKFDKNCTNVGSHKAKITFINSYAVNKSVTKTYKITPKTTSIKKLTPLKKGIKVEWKKQSLKMSAKRITGYQIRLATNKNFTKNKKTIKVKGYKITSKKVTKLKANKTYYVKIRTYKTIKGKNFYGKWSKAEKVRTK